MSKPPPLSDGVTPIMCPACDVEVDYAVNLDNRKYPHGLFGPVYCPKCHCAVLAYMINGGPWNTYRYTNCEKINGHCRPPIEYVEHSDEVLDEMTQAIRKARKTA